MKYLNVFQKRNKLLMVSRM